MTLNIAFLTLEYPPGGGGIAASLATLAPALTSLGHQVSVVGWGGQRSEVEDGVNIEFLEPTGVPRLGWWLNPRRVEKLLASRVRRGELDILVAHDWCGPSARVDPGCPVVIVCHGSATYFGDLTGEAVPPRVRAAERRALHNATRVGAVSRFTGSQTQRLFDLVQAPSFLPNAVDCDAFRPVDRDQVEITRFVYCGTLVRKKGVLDLCRAFNRVVEQRPRASLAIVGRDSRDAATGSPSTWALCLEELSPRALAAIDLRGFLPHDEVRAITATSVAAILPSHAEALPLAWMETMACARPVVGYDLGWARELVSSGVDGLLVEENDDVALARAMVDLLDDSERSHRLGAEARRRMLADFDRPVVVERFEAWLVESRQRWLEGTGEQGSGRARR